MKTLTMVFICLLLVSTMSLAETCNVELAASHTDHVNHVIDTKAPKYLEKGKIVVQLPNGKTYLFNSNEYMVVPRKQQILTGERSLLVYNHKCVKKETVVVKEKIDNNKNMIYADVRKDHQDLKTEYNGKSVSIESEKGIVPSINYYRRELFDSPIGVGLGVDTNGTVKGALGIDF